MAAALIVPRNTRRVVFLDSKVFSDGEVEKSGISLSYPIL
jgi:hypothetical protein